MTSETDSGISEAYRDAAGEQVPGHLNEAILAQAKRAAKPPYARSRAWTRPLAWAAMAVLSVAIVLEITQLAEINGIPEKAALPAAGEAYPLTKEAPMASGIDAVEMAAPACPDDATRDPETWLACIEELEKAGLTEEAGQQRKLLIEAFPEFELP